MIVSYIPRDEPVTIAVRLFCSVAKLRVHLGASVEARGNIVSFGEACHSACVGERNAMVTCLIDHYDAVHDEVKRRYKYERMHLVDRNYKEKEPTAVGCTYILPQISKSRVHRQLYWMFGYAEYATTPLVAPTWWCRT
jgi:hypothetical protein